MDEDSLKYCRAPRRPGRDRDDLREGDVAWRRRGCLEKERELEGRIEGERC